MAVRRGGPGGRLFADWGRFGAKPHSRVPHQGHWKI